MVLWREEQSDISVEVSVEGSSRKKKRLSFGLCALSALEVVGFGPPYLCVPSSLSSSKTKARGFTGSVTR